MSFEEDPSPLDYDLDLYELEAPVTPIITTTPKARGNPNFVTLTSPDEPTATGIAEVIPLTTIWKPLHPERCEDDSIVDNVDLIRSCLPPHAQNVWEFNGHYSPGICPEKWTIACTGTGSSVNGKTIDHGETVGFCVPATMSNVVCRNDRSRVRFFTTTNQYAYDVNLLPLEVRWQSADLSILQTTPNVKNIAGPVTKLSFEYARPRNSSAAEQKLLRQVQARDDLEFADSETWSDVSASSTGFDAVPGGSGLPDVSSDLSAGAVAGIGVGVGIAVILILAAGIFVWMRKRRERVAASGGGGPAELRGNPSLIFEKDSDSQIFEKDAENQVAEKDSTPLNRDISKFGLRNGLNGEGDLNVKPLILNDDYGTGPVELPSTPRRATLAPTPQNRPEQPFPYTYMSSPPQWQAYQGPEQPHSVYDSIRSSGEGVRGEPQIPPPTAKTLPDDLLGTQQNLRQQPTAPSNIAYQVEIEQLARLQERRKRLLELERIDREEEEILRRIQQQEREQQK